MGATICAIPIERPPIRHIRATMRFRRYYARDSMKKRSRMTTLMLVEPVGRASSCSPSFLILFLSCLLVGTRLTYSIDSPCVRIHEEKRRQRRPIHILRQGRYCSARGEYDLSFSCITHWTSVPGMGRQTCLGFCFE
jgi:hypothetical protein